MIVNILHNIYLVHICIRTPNRAFISVYIIRCHLLSYLRAVIFAKLS